MFPAALGIEDRFRLACDAGFDGVEMNTVEDEETVRQMAHASGKTGVRIHSVLSSGQWKYPLSSDDPAVVAQSIANIETSMRNAKAVGADTVLVVPGVVNPQTSYKDCYARSTNAIRKLADRAAEMQVILGIENVWNKFLLSPLEFVQFVDQFNSPWIRAYFDVGNVVLYAYPQDWIRTLGHRIAKIHVKDFDRDHFKWKPLLEGSIDWKEVHKALQDVGYRGFITAELPAGDENYLRDVSKRMSRIIEGKM